MNNSYALFHGSPIPEGLKRYPGKRTLLACSLAVSVFSTALICRAQSPAQSPTSDLGTIAGHVRGPGGVPIPGATVQVVEKQTGERKETWTDEDGNYSLEGLHPGTYKLDVSLLGLRPDAREPVPVAAGKSISVDVALVLTGPEPSAESQRRNMVAGPAGARSLQNLPAELRSRLNDLAAGAQPQAGGTEGSGNGVGANVRFTENSGGGQLGGESSGAESESVPNADAGASASGSFLLSGSVANAAMPQGDEGRQRDRMRERFEEFRQNGEGGGGFGGGEGGFGGGGGRGGGGFGGGPGGPGGGAMGFLGGRGQRRAQVNRVRGNISEEFSNSALNARAYPLNNASSPPVPAYRETFRLTFGGPLVIPKIYHGKEKTSFFVNYNLQRNKSPFDNYYTVPTAAERIGDFSQAFVPSGPLAGTVPTIFDPSSATRGTRTPFVGNRIPSQRFDSAAVGLLQFIPLPNLPGVAQNFHLREALPSNSSGIMGRIGHRISAKDNINGVYFLQSTHSMNVSAFPALTSTSSGRSQNVNLGEMHAFRPHFINNLMFNFNRSRTSALNPFAFQQNISGQLGIQGVSQDPRDWGLPAISFTNFAGINDTIPSLTRNQTFRVVDFLIWNHGKHNVRLGGELRKVQLNSLRDPDPRGTFSFTGFTTSDFSAQRNPVAGTGIDFADFLLGLPQATSARFGVGSNYLRSSVYSTFVQDDWRFASRLTFNLGLRYEYFTPFTEKYGHLSNLDVGPGFSSVSLVTGQSPGPFPAALIRSNPKEISPRIGVAYRPWTQHRLVFRAGYGVFFDSSIYQRFALKLINQPPFAQASTLQTNPQQVLTLEQGFPQIDPNILKNTYAVDPNFQTPYGQTWSFGLEHEIVRNVIFSATYTGTKGTKLDLLLGPNRFDSQNQLVIRNAQQFTYETSGASSTYHGLQISLRRQYHGGFSLGGNYTFAKSIDDAAAVGGAGAVVAQDLDLRAERGLSSFDVRHRLSLNYDYEFPFGGRRRYLNHGGALAKLLDDWQVSGNGVLQSGTPFTARVGGNQSSAGGLGTYFAGRAEATGLPVGLPWFRQSTLEYFNAAAFTLPPPGQFGNAGKNTIIGPRSVSFDMELSRSVIISREKGVRANFRIEARNVFNTPTYGGLNTTVDAVEFGRVTSVRPMRSMNFAMRFTF